MKLTNQASTHATLRESDNAFLTSARIESQEVSPKVEAAFSDLKLKDPLVNTFEQNQPSLDQHVDQLQDNLFVDIGFNADDINVNLDMIDISPLENLRPPIDVHDFLTEFDQSMLFDAKDMVNMMNEIKDMAMGTAGAGWDGNHGTTWDGPFTGETQAGDSCQSGKEMVPKLITLIMEKQLPRKNIMPQKKQMRMECIILLAREVQIPAMMMKAAGVSGIRSGIG